MYCYVTKKHYPVVLLHLVLRAGHWGVCDELGTWFPPVSEPCLRLCNPFV